MDAISSQEESGFPGFCWRYTFTFHKSLKRSLPSAIVRGTLSLLPQVEWIPRCPDSKEGQIFLQWLECRLLFHRTRWSNVWMPCGDTKDSPRCPTHLARVLTSLDTSRGTRISVLQKVTMPDSSLKLIGIPISLCQIEKMAWSPSWFPEASALSCQAYFTFLRWHQISSRLVTVLLGTL